MPRSPIGDMLGRSNELEPLGVEKKGWLTDKHGVILADFVISIAGQTVLRLVSSLERLTFIFSSAIANCN